MHQRADMWAEDMAKLLNSATPTKRKRLQDMNITILNKDESLQHQVNTKVVENVQKCRDDLKKLRSPEAKSRRQLLSDIVLGNASGWTNIIKKKKKEEENSTPAMGSGNLSDPETQTSSSSSDTSSDTQDDGCVMIDWADIEVDASNITEDGELCKKEKGGKN